MAMNADITIVFSCKWFYFDLLSRLNWRHALLSDIASFFDQKTSFERDDEWQDR